MKTASYIGFIPEFSVSEEWVPKVGDLCVNFRQGVRIMEIGYTDTFGTFHSDMILVKTIGLTGSIGKKYYANIKFLKPAI